MSKPTFEERLSKLETIVKKLESDIPLDQALQQYDEGIKLADDCQKELQQVEKRILKLVEENDQVKAIPVEEHEYPTLF